LYDDIGLFRSSAHSSRADTDGGACTPRRQTKTLYVIIREIDARGCELDHCAIAATQL
jgi:hypothetical protein